MPVGAAIGGIVGGGISAYGATKAAKTQANAAKSAQATLAPYTQAGSGAITSLAQLYGIATPGNPNPGEAFGSASLEQFRKSPDYSFAYDEGLKAVEGSNAGKGLLQSGNHLRDLTSFGQGLASQQFGNYFSRLMQLANLGQGAASNTASLQTAQGEAKASGLVGAGNAINQSISGTGNNLLLYNLLNKGGSGSAYGGFGGSYGKA